VKEGDGTLSFSSNLHEVNFMHVAIVEHTAEEWLKLQSTANE